MRSWPAEKFPPAPQITITFASAQDINRIRIVENNPANYFTQADFEYFDGSAWRPLLSKSKSSSGMDETFGSVRAYKVRMTVNASFAK